MTNILKLKKGSYFWVFLFLFIALAVFPIFIKSNYFISIMIYCLAFACFGSSWNLIGGYGGQISWCHSAFVAIGAYVAYICLKYWNISPWLTIPIGAIISLLFASLIGYGTFRLRGVYFSLATMAFAEILRLLLLYFKDYTGGAAGLYVPYEGQNFTRLQFASDVPFYYILLVLFILVTIFVSKFEETKTGNYLKLIRDDEDAARSLGIETFAVKLRAFQISAVIASVTGVFYGFFLAFIDPLSLSGNEFAVKIGLVSIIGGLGSILGPVLGAFIIIPLTEGASVVFGSTGGSQILYGLGIIIIVLFMPSGLITVIQNLFDKRKKNENDDKNQGKAEL